MHTFRGLGIDRLSSLSSAIGADATPWIDTLTTLIAPWADCVVGSTPRWPSDITDDGTPLELSFGIENDWPEVRFLVESQGEDGSLEARWRAGLATNERLKERYGISLERFDKVADLFQPTAAQAHFAMWHAAWFRGESPLLKVYLNPAARGPATAPLVTESALNRLGFHRAWKLLEGILARRYGDRLIYFSLDLAGSRDARVKVYIAHHAATAADVEPLIELGPEPVPGDAPRFCEAMTGGTGPFLERPLITCYAFNSDRDEKPSSVTLHLPVRCYVDDDETAMNRIVRHIGEPVGTRYRKALEAVSRRPLSAGVGMQTYSSFRRSNGRLRMTVYVALEAYRTEPARVVTPHAHRCKADSPAAAE